MIHWGRQRPMLAGVRATFLVCALFAVAAATAATRDGASVPTIEQVQQRIEALKKAPLADAKQQKQALGLYQRALQELHDAQKYAKQADVYQAAMDSAPEKTQHIHKALKEKPYDAAETIPADASIDSLEQMLKQRQSDLATLHSQLDQLKNQLSAEKARPDAARKSISQAKQRLDQIAAELAALPRADEGAALTEARRAALDAERPALTAKIDMLKQELSSNETRVDLLNAQRDLLQDKASALEQAVTRVHDALDARHREEAALAARKAQQAKHAAVGKAQIVRRAATINAQLSEELTSVIDNTDAASRESEATQEQLQQLTRDYESAHQQLEIAGLTQALGAVLQEQRRSLPNIGRFEARPDKWADRIAAARLREFRVDEQRRELSDLDQRVQQILAKRKNHQLTLHQYSQDKRELRALLTNRQALLEKLSTDYSRYVGQLTALRRAHAALAQQAQQYAELLDENLVWIASAPPIGLSWFPKLGQSALWLLSPSHWRQVTGALVHSAHEHVWIPPIIVLLFIGLVWLRGHIRLRLKSIVERIGNVTRDRFHFTVEALIYSVLYALPWPLLIATIGRMILIADDVQPFARAVGIGLERTALWFLILEWLRHLCAEHGLIQAHFRWREQSRNVLRRNLPWLMALELPCTVIVVMTEWQTEQLYRDALGRLTFIVASLGLAVFLWLMFRRGSGALAGLVGSRSDGWRWYLRYLLYPVAVGSPVMLSALAITGYYFTALQLEGRLYITGWIVVGAVIVLNLIVRWLNVAERRLALARARARREQAQAQRASKEGDGDGIAGEVAPEAMEVPEIALETINDQTRTLLQLFIGLGVLSGLWLVWQDMLPALNVIGDVTIWHQTVGSGANSKILPITLGNLAIALLLLVVTVKAARNLPGLLELTVLRRLALEPGNRYAITTVSRYAIFTIGVLTALNSIGIGWQQAQWLVAAIGVGLGFGLQEIFANFVSGLIILFERPIRIGDTVTVDNITGTVTRIRMRATTITDWDRKELIVPNKNFITGPVVNWSLSDSVTRIIIKIRAPYGSDTQLVHRLILEEARANPRVLDDPAPQAYLLEFGESALNFELRVFVRDLGDWLPLAHEFHMGVEQALKRHGIEIPFPQRDIHVRTTQPTLRLKDDAFGVGDATSSLDETPAPDAKR